MVLFKDHPLAAAAPVACAINANDAETHISGAHRKTNLNDNEPEAFYRVALLYGGVPAGDLLAETVKGISVGCFRLVALHRLAGKVGG